MRKSDFRNYIPLTKPHLFKKLKIQKCIQEKDFHR